VTDTQTWILLVLLAIVALAAVKYLLRP